MDTGTAHVMSWSEPTKGHVPPPLTVRKNIPRPRVTQQQLTDHLLHIGAIHHHLPAPRTPSAHNLSVRRQISSDKAPHIRHVGYGPWYENMGARRRRSWPRPSLFPFNGRLGG